jgi:hypothetical protein
VKFAVTVCGPVIVTVHEVLVGLPIFPLQLVNVYPLFGVLVMKTTEPES